MNGEESPLEASERSPASQVVKSGLQMGRGETFWDDFVRLCSNSDGMADLLGVRPDQVSGWIQRVGSLVDRAKDEDRGGVQVLQTGGAVHR